MMFIHLVVLLFAAVEAIPSGRFDVVYPSMETFRSGIKRIKFRALNQDIELRMEPAGDVIADDFKLIRGKNTEIDHSLDIQSLKRKLYKDAEMGAALHIDEDGPLTINGIVNSKLRIRPDTSEKARRNGTIAHRVTEVIEDEQLIHDYKTLPPGLTRTFNHTEPLSDDKCIKIEYVFISEHKFTEKFEKNGLDMVEYLANMMNKVEILLSSLDLAIDVVINSIQVLTEKNQLELAPYIPPLSIGIDVDKTLDNMVEFYCKSKDSVVPDADIVMLITPRHLGYYANRRTFISKYHGMTFRYGSCDKCYKYAIVRDEPELDQRADNVAHESAHLLGCKHDGEGDDITGSKDCPASDGYIMGTKNEKNGKKFSPCCKRTVKHLLTNLPNHCIIKTCDNSKK